MIILPLAAVCEMKTNFSVSGAAAILTVFFAESTDQQ